MTKAKYSLPVFLIKRESPDEELLKDVKELMNSRKGISEIRRILNISDSKASRYYWQVKNGRW